MKMWLSKTLILVAAIFFALNGHSTAQCPYKFMPYNDSNCYFMRYHLVTYQEAKDICTYLKADMYVPDASADYEAIGYWIRQYTLVNPWIGIKKVMNYTHANG